MPPTPWASTGTPSRRHSRLPMPKASAREKSVPKCQLRSSATKAASSRHRSRKPTGSRQGWRGRPAGSGPTARTRVGRPRTARASASCSTNGPPLRCQSLPRKPSRRGSAVPGAAGGGPMGCVASTVSSRFAPPGTTQTRPGSTPQSRITEAAAQGAMVTTAPAACNACFSRASTCRR